MSIVGPSFIDSVDAAISPPQKQVEGGAGNLVFGLIERMRAGLEDCFLDIYQVDAS